MNFFSIVNATVLYRPQLVEPANAELWIQETEDVEESQIPRADGKLYTDF